MLKAGRACPVDLRGRSHSPRGRPRVQLASSPVDRVVARLTYRHVARRSRDVWDVTRGDDFRRLQLSEHQRALTTGTQFAGFPLEWVGGWLPVCPRSGPQAVVEERFAPRECPTLNSGKLFNTKRINTSPNPHRIHASPKCH